MCNLVFQFRFLRQQLRANLFTFLPASSNKNKWSKQFSIRPHRRRTLTAQSSSPGGANVPSHHNACFLRPIGVQNPNGISIGSAIFAQFTAECRRACPGMSCPLEIAPLRRKSGPHLMGLHAFIGPLVSITQTASRSVQPFCRAHYCDRQTDRQTTLLGR